MINLIKNELIKISKKKSFYIALIVTLAFIIFANVVYKIERTYSYDLADEISFYEEQLKDIDPNNKEDQEIYVSYQVELQAYKLMQKYGDSSTWQAKIIGYQGRNLINQMVYAKDIEKNDVVYSQAKKQYDNFVAKLDSGDWKYFVSEELKGRNQTLQDLNVRKQAVTDKYELEDIEDQIYNIETQKQVLEWRLEEDICYGTDYKNQALSTYDSSRSAVREFETYDNSQRNEKQKYEDKKEYYNYLENLAISKYDIENGTEIGNSSTARGILLQIFSEFEIFIIILSVMVAGTIVSEEFNKGTIKLLLIKPYKRAKILTAKFLTAIIMLIIFILIIMLMQFVVGGIVQGFSSFDEPMAVYNHNTNALEEISFIKYLSLLTASKLPIYVLLLTLAFALSTLFSNSALAIAITLLGSMSASIINTLALGYNLDWIKFFVTPNWDLSQYLFGGLPQFYGLTFGFSVTIIVVYMIIMLVPSYAVFKKRNIKNI